MNDEKCVIVIDESLPVGIIANTAAILGITMGTKMPSVVGGDVVDKEGHAHMGIIRFPVPILKGNAQSIGALRSKLFSDEYRDLTVADFTELAQSCKTYDEFIGKMAKKSDLKYIGLAICGCRKKVNKLTGSMALLR